MNYSIEGYAKATILDYQKKIPLLHFDQVHFADINLQGSNKIAKGGEQGLNLMGWNDQNQGDFTLYTPTFSMKFLEIAAGSDLTGGMTTYLTTEVLPIENNSIEIDTTSIVENSLKIYQLDSSGEKILDPINITSIEDGIVNIGDNIGGWALLIFEIIEDVEFLNIGKFINKGYYTIIGQVNIYTKSNSDEMEILKFTFPKVMINHIFNVKVLNNRNPDQVYALNCKALIEDSNDKSLLRVIKRK